jgi:protein TonB
MSKIKESRESLDEIVFENRNKVYGAYQIRKQYKKELNRSLFIVLFMFSLSIGLMLFMSFKGKEEFTFTPEEPIWRPIDIPKPDFKTPEPPPTSEKNDEAKIESQTKFEIVKEVSNSSEVVEMPSNENFQNKDISGKFEISNDSYNEPPVISVDDNVYEIFIIEEEPIFPGGDKALKEWIKENTVYPEIPKKEGITGKVYLSFVIDKDGNVIDVKLIRGLDRYLDNEAINVVKNMPRWIPGKHNGEPVKVLKRMDIKFVLE